MFELEIAVSFVPVGSPHVERSGGAEGELEGKGKNDDTQQS